MKGLLNQMTHLTFIIMEINHNNLTDYVHNEANSDINFSLEIEQYRSIS